MASSRSSTSRSAPSSTNFGYAEYKSRLSAAGRFRSLANKRGSPLVRVIYCKARRLFCRANPIEWRTMKIKFIGTILVLSVISVVSADEVLDAAEAVREMIQGMDIPQEEKNELLAQIGTVETVQKSAIRTDISAVLLEFELALDAWVGNDRKMKEYIQGIEEMNQKAERALKEGEFEESRAWAKAADDLLWDIPAGSLPLMRKTKTLDDILAQQFAAAERDRVDVSVYSSRYQSAVTKAEKSLGKALSEYYKENELD